jgi:hypothetical protein
MSRLPIALLVDPSAPRTQRPVGRRIQDPALVAALHAGNKPRDLAAAVSGRFQPFSDPDLAHAPETGTSAAAAAGRRAA